MWLDGFSFKATWSLLCVLFLSLLGSPLLPRVASDCEGYIVARKVKGLDCGVSHGLINTALPKSPVVLPHLAVLCCFYVLLRHEGLRGSCEPQLYSFSSLNTQLFFSGILCLPRAQPGRHSSLGPRFPSLPLDQGKLFLMWITISHHGLFLKDIVLLSSDSIFSWRIGLSETISQEISQGGLTSAVLRQLGTEAWRKEGKNTESERVGKN